MTQCAFMVHAQLPTTTVMITEFADSHKLHTEDYAQFEDRMEDSPKRRRKGEGDTPSERMNDSLKFISAVLPRSYWTMMKGGSSDGLSHRALIIIMSLCLLLLIGFTLIDLIYSIEP